MEVSLFKRYDRQFWVLIGGSMINSFGYSLVYPFIALYLYLHRGIPMTEVGLILLAASLLQMFSQVMAGELSDRIGRKTILITGITVSTLGFGLLTMAILTDAGIWEFFAFLCIREAASGFYRSMPTIMITDVVPAGDRTSAFSLQRIGWNLGFALGPMIGGVLAIYSYAFLFGIATITSGTYLLISLFMLRDIRPEKGPIEKKTGYSVVLRDQPFLLYCGITAAIMLVYAQMFSTFNTYSGSYGGINESAIGILFSMNCIMVVTLSYPLARFLERFRITTSLMAGTLIYAVGFGIVGFCSGFWQLAGCIFIISVGELINSPSATNMASRLARPENRGRYMSLSDVMMSMGFAFGPAVGGFLMDLYAGNIEVMWLIMGGLLVGCVLGLILLRKKVDGQVDLPTQIAVAMSE